MLVVKKKLLFDFIHNKTEFDFKTEKKNHDGYLMSKKSVYQIIVVHDGKK